MEGDGRFGKFAFADASGRDGFQALIGDKKRSPFRLYQLASQSRAFTAGQMDRMIRQSSHAYARMFRSSLGQYDLLRFLVISLLFRNTGGERAS